MKLYKSHFINWLLSKEDHEIVGDYIRVSRCCPIANFIKETQGGCPSVVKFGIVYEGQYSTNPIWVQQFIAENDKTMLGERVPTTASWALELMGIGFRARRNRREKLQKVCLRNSEKKNMTEWEWANVQQT